jgi:hypothetical protein
MGFNASPFDLELLRAEESKRLDGEAVRTQALIDRGSMNRAGTLFKTGIIVINGHELLETHRRIEEKKVKDKEDKDKVEAETEATKVRAEIEAALFFWVQWRRRGKRLDGQGKVQLSKDEALAIVKVLLPRLNPKKKLSDYARNGSCVD